MAHPGINYSGMVILMSHMGGVGGGLTIKQRVLRNLHGKTILTSAQSFKKQNKTCNYII